jgi:6-pyruvoyltetrahydropterin/6-carboxytetrahydropterin synthase
MLTATKRFTFDYAHYLPNYDGDCSKMHGHHGIAEITIARNPKTFSQTGMVIDFNDIKKIVGPIIDKLDHCCLNDLFDNPTAEIICLWIYAQVKQTELGDFIVKIRVYETPDNWVDYFE